MSGLLRKFWSCLISLSSTFSISLSRIVARRKKVLARSHRYAHKLALRYSTSTLCFLLVLIGIPVTPHAKGQNNPNADGIRTKGAPGSNLPNLEQTRAAGARDEMPPEIKPQPSKAATRCRMRDQVCKANKEKVGFVPQPYDRFSGLLAQQRSFDWTAKPVFSRLPELDALLATPGVEKAMASLPDRPTLSNSTRGSKVTKSQPRAFASSFFPAVVQTIGNWETARVDEINRTGTGGEDLFSGNYNWSLPLISLPGRAGHDLTLTLSYNSLVWLKWSGQMRFDHDWTWPSIGFHLGFPTFIGPYVNTQTNLESYQMFTPSGRVVELRRVGTVNGTGVFEARDGSLTRLTFNASGYAVLTTTDGMTYTYGQTLDIKDRNGNLITVSYNSLGLYSAITDTLGRVINFNYGAYNDLQTITQTWDNLTKTLVTFNYDNTFQLWPAFSGVTPENVTNGQYEPVLYQLDLLDGTHYNFQYNTYGQIIRIERKGANYNLRTWTAYDLPVNNGSPTDCPRYTKRTDWAVDWSPAAGYDTTFCFSDAACPWTANHLVSKVTAPDGTTQRVVFADYTQQGKAWMRGLTTQTEVWASGVRKKYTTLSWENSGTLYQLNPRINETNLYDDAGNRRRTYTEYWDSSYNLPSWVTEYDANGTTILRQTLTNYNYNSQYLTRRLIGLPTERILYDGSGAVQAKVQYFYDEAGYLQAHATQPIRHDSTSGGTAGNYGSNFSYRGNLTGVRRYDINNLTQYVENKTGYYITGNPAYTRDALGHQTTFAYNGMYMTDVGLPETRPNTYAYLGIITDPDGYTSSINYHFDRGDVRRTIDPKGAQTRRDYDGMGRMWKVINEENNAYTRYSFDPNHNYVQSYTTIQEGQGEFYSITTFDGHGRPRAIASDHPGSTTGYKAQYTGYDNMGRVYQQSNPAEINGSNWSPAGDDVAGWAWRYQTYDWNGRPLVTTNQDGTTKSISYAGCGCAGGQVETISDEGDGVLVGGQPRRRQQKIFHDVLGRVTKTQVLNWDSSVYSTTVNTYNVRDQLTDVKEYSGTATGAEVCPSATCQKTDLSYDGHGRLAQRKLPIESTATTYSYFADDMAQTMTDARGASVTYGYNNRHLATSLTYGVPSGVAATSNVTFGYDAAGNRTSMNDGPGSVTYTYDTLSRLQTETRTFTGLSGTFPLTYTYNLVGQVKTVTDNRFNTTLTYNYDKAGQLTTFNGTGYVGSGTTDFISPSLPVKYRAWGAIKEINYGNTLKSTYSYGSRLYPTAYRLLNASAVTQDGSDYQYYPDSRLKFASNLVASSPAITLASAFDRAYQYDHLGRLTTALSGVEASGGSAPTPPSVNLSPYKQTNSYDVWGNLTGRGSFATPNRFWRSNPYDTATYIDNRRQGPSLSYDNAGNLLSDGSVQSFYDAAGRIIQSNTITPPVGSGNTSQPSSELAVSLAGDGTIAKRVETRRSDTPTQTPPVTTSITTTYYVRSSVAGGDVLAEVNDQGAKNKGYIYALGGRLAEQVGPAPNYGVLWRHTNPVTGTLLKGTTNGVFGTDARTEFDPLGAEVGNYDLWANDPTPTYQELKGSEPLYIEGGDPFNLQSGCTLDGMPMSCTRLASKIENGSVQFREQNGKLRGVDHLGNGAFYVPGVGTGLKMDGQVVIPDGQDDPGYFVSVRSGSGRGWGALTGTLSGLLVGQQSGALMQDAQGGKLTKQQCDVLRELLAREVKYGTNGAAVRSTVTKIKYTDALTLSDSLLGPFDTTFHPNIRLADGNELDLDWFTTLVQFAKLQGTKRGTLLIPVDAYSKLMIYAGGKGMWSKIRIEDLDATPSTINMYPFSDPGERTAFKAFLLNKKYKDLFTPEFFDKYCK